MLELNKVNRKIENLKKDRALAFELLTTAGYTDEEAKEILKYCFGGSKRISEKKSSKGGKFDALPIRAKRAYFAKLTSGKTAGTVYPKGKSGKRTKPKGPTSGGGSGGFSDAEKEIMAELEAKSNVFGTIGGDPRIDNIVTTEILTGRAPRGKGKEWQDRRWIAKRIGTHEKFRSQITFDAPGKSKSQRDLVYQRASARKAQLSKAIDAAYTIGAGPGDWSFKKELIKGIFDATAGERAAYLGT